MFFDTHVHFDTLVRDPDRLDTALERAAAAGVTRMLAVGGDEEANRTAAELSCRFPGRIWASAGYERGLAGQALDFTALREVLDQPGMVAVGETGLDYFHTPDTAPQQKKLFEETLALAVELDLPAIVHTRDADEDTLAVLRTFAVARRGDPARAGVIHCFTRDKRFARSALDLGFYISYSGILTFLNADPLRDTVRYVPDDRLLIETDTPYLTPVPHRGQRNEPAFVGAVAEKLAELKGVDVETVARTTARNAAVLLGIDPERETD